MERASLAGLAALLAACGGATTDPAPSQRIRQLAVGEEQVCVVRESGALECFDTGASLADAVFPLAAGRFKRVSVGGRRAAALGEDGAVQYWRFDDGTLPTGTFLDVTTDGAAACGIRSDGSVECGGLDGMMERSPLPGRFTQVVLAATGGVCGITDSGELLCHQEQAWPVPPPKGGLDELASVAIERTASAGGCGVTRAGALECWGVCAPPGTYRAVALTHVDTCALASNGELRCWANAPCDTDGPELLRRPLNMPPPGTFTLLAASLYQMCAVNAAGDDVLCW